jgi:hypothetical protein
MLPNHEMLTIPVYCVTVIVLVIPPTVTVIELLVVSSGSPSELKVNVIGLLFGVPIVTADGNADGNRPVGSRLLVEGVVRGNV